MTSLSQLVGAPLAPFVGPFVHRPFLEICASHDARDVTVLADGSNGIALVADDDAVRFVGDRHLTDYHSPLGTGTGELVAMMTTEFDGSRFDLDSLPREAVDPLVTAFGEMGLTTKVTADEPCRVLQLGEADPNEWATLLRSKDRHEVRRKRRRYEAARGEPMVASGSEHFEAFVALHRSAAGDKGDFMTDRMEAFFRDLLRLPVTRLDVLHHDGTAEAAAFGFEDDEGYYLYNSAYEAALAEFSPGIILIDRLIAQTAQKGTARFDFLKGAESYKRRLGAVERPLFRLAVAT